MARSALPAAIKTLINNLLMDTPNSEYGFSASAVLFTRSDS